MMEKRWRQEIKNGKRGSYNRIPRIPLIDFGYIASNTGNSHQYSFIRTILVLFIVVALGYFNLNFIRIDDKNE